jgi:16S rRNA (cytidine1402-2'-O)-methyltransferase
MSKTGKLILFPNFINPEQDPSIFSEAMHKAMAEIDGCVVENEKIARALLKNFKFSNFESFRELPLYLLNEHVMESQEIIDILKSGKNLGLISDAGLPCIADPGSNLVFKAKRQGVKIEVVGVYSSIIHSLMASGLAQQSFYFVGYMPKEDKPFSDKIKKLEALSKQEKTTIIFIETPYRNQACLSQLIKFLSKDSFIAYCQDVGSANEHIYLDSCGAFKMEMAKVQKSPATFVFRAS